MKKQNIIKQNGEYYFFNEIEIKDQLEVGNYKFNYNSKGGMFLQDVPALKMPEKVYEIDVDFRNTIKSVFNKLDKNVGVLLTGYKGTGKSLLSKQICNDSNLPVIMITDVIPKGIDFVGFLNDIQQDVVIFIDEFEKIFHKVDASGKPDESDYHNQNSFLTMMDGALSNGAKKLFILTTNKEVDEHFINRPSRIRYYKKYEFINEELYNVIIADKLVNKSHEQDLRDNLPLIECSVDILNTIIEEMNVTEQPYSVFKENFNHKAPRVTYVMEELVLGEFKYKDHIDVDQEITRDNIQRSISHYAKLLSVSNDGITYSDKHYQPWINEDGSEDEDKDGKWVKVIRRIKKSTANVTTGNDHVHKI